MTTQPAPEQQKILENFQKMRQDQQSIAQEISRIEADLREHQTVLKTVEQLNGERKCFRQVGDTVVEHTGAELVEILDDVIKRFQFRIQELTDRLVELGKEINAFKEKNNIRLLSQKDVMEIQRKQALEQIAQMPKAGDGGSTAAAKA